MRISVLIERLWAPHPDHRRAAANALVAAGAQAVGPLVAALRDSDRWHAPGYLEVLQRIGGPAFWPLVDALANMNGPRGYPKLSPSPQSNPVGKALQGLVVSDRDMFVRLLSHGSRNVRSWACSAVTAMGTEYVPLVLPLLADEDPDVRYSACEVFGRLTNESFLPHLPALSSYLPALLALLVDPVDFVRIEASHVIRRIGPRLEPVLREMRRSPEPYRWHALAGLAETVGWDRLDPADQALVRRLIRIRIPREVPEPFEPDGQWYAVPTRDQAAVLDALDLSDPMPVTMRLGQVAASNGYILDGKVGYVAPVLDGWTLAFVWQPDEFEDRTAALSRRFGTAHGYVHWDDYHGCGLASGWCTAENGTIIRCYCHQGDEPYQTGAPLPAEHGCLLPHEDGADDVDWCFATDIAARISVDPTAIGPHTRIEGHPALALTADGRHDGVTPGALPV